MSRQLLQYHPKIGHTFIPGIKARVPHESGGYLVRVNAHGFRCDYEFEPIKPDCKFRILLFGDSFTAGNGVSNGERYGDLIEKSIPNLEVFNFGLPGIGTDQQFIAYQEFSGHIEHDLLMIGVLVENINRVKARYRPYADDNSKILIYAKPYYQVEHGKLILNNVPVPKNPIEESNMPPDEAKHVDRGGRFATLRKIVRNLGIKDIAQKITRYQIFPDYKDPANPNWILMRTILEEWVRLSKTPVIIVPIPFNQFIDGYCDPSYYQARFREVAKASGAIVHDPLPDLQKYSLEERLNFRFKNDYHFSQAGHAALANSLIPVIKKLIN